MCKLEEKEDVRRNHVIPSNLACEKVPRCFKQIIESNFPDVEERYISDRLFYATLDNNKKASGFSFEIHLFEGLKVKSHALLPFRQSVWDRI